MKFCPATRLTAMRDQTDNREGFHVVGPILARIVTAIAIAAFLFVPNLYAQRSGSALPVGSSGHSPFVPIVQKLKDAVVNISAEKVVDARRFHSFDPFFEDWFGPDIGRSRQKSLGSGFIFRADGYILTNHHVVAEADNITVRLSDKMELPATVVGTDPATDLAVLKIDAKHELTVIPLGDSDSILVGDWAIAIGNPFPAQGLDRTITVGVISAVGRKQLYFGDETPVYQNYIQTDASINPGNSGGPLVNLDGEAIGINAAIASPTGSNVGIGFAIPVNFAKMVIPDILADGRVSRGWLGVEPRDVTWDDVEAEGLTVAEGAIINRVLPGTPAEKSRLKAGDVVLSVGGEKIDDAQHFMRTIWRARAGATVEMDVLRGGRHETIAVTLGDRDAYQASATDEETMPGQSRDSYWLGLQVATCTPENARELGSKYHTGVIVTDIEPASPAYEKGIRVGMIIGEIDHKPVESEMEYEDVVAGLGDQSRAVSLLVYDRSGQTRYIAVRPDRQR